MRTMKKRIRRIVTGMICLLLMFTLTGCQIKIDIPGLGQIRLGDSKEEKEDAESKKQKKTKKPDSGKSLKQQIQISLSVQRSLLRIYERVWMAHYSNLQ